MVHDSPPDALGEIAWSSWPSCQECVERVQADPAVHVQDMVWIAEALHTRIRVTIRRDVHETIKAAFPDLPKNMVFGQCHEQTVSAHLFFSWVKDCSGQRDMGHFTRSLPWNCRTMWLGFESIPIRFC